MICLRIHEHVQCTSSSDPLVEVLWLLCLDLYVLAQPAELSLTHTSHPLRSFTRRRFPFFNKSPYMSIGRTTVLLFLHVVAQLARALPRMRVSGVQVPPEEAYFSLKNDCFV